MQHKYEMYIVYKYRLNPPIIMLENIKLHQQILLWFTFDVLSLATEFDRSPGYNSYGTCKYFQIAA